jgi:hypothetical protein
MAEGVVEAGEGRRRRLVTVANETGARGGKSELDSIESQEGGGGSVSMGGAEAKRTALGRVSFASVGTGGVGADGIDQFRKAL